MWRIIAFLFLLNLIFLATDYSSDETGGINTTKLTADITKTTVSIPVQSTAGYPSGNATITIGQEDIFYTSKDATHFITATTYRGYGQTVPAIHDSGSLVYDMYTGSVNKMLNYDITTTETGGGAGGTASASVVSSDDSVFNTVLPNFFTWNYYVLNSNEIGQFIRTILLTICGILTVIIGWNMLPFTGKI
jgi:hypothetical protein